MVKTARIKSESRMPRSLVLIALVSILSCSAAHGERAQTPANIDKNGVLILVKSTLIALDQSNKTGNYTVLRDLGSSGFKTNTAARLGQIFANQSQLDLSGVIVIDPQLTTLPQIESNGMMRIAGYFPSVPRQINFEMLFAPENGEWRIFGLGVSESRSGPKAPNPKTEQNISPPVRK